MYMYIFIYWKKHHACFIDGSGSIEYIKVIEICPDKFQPHVSSTGSHYSSSVISTEFTKKIGWLTTAITNFKIKSPYT